MRYIQDTAKAKNPISKFISHMNVKRLNKYILGLGRIDCNILAVFADFVKYVDDNLFIKDTNIWVEIKDNKDSINFHTKDFSIWIALYKMDDLNSANSGKRFFTYSITVCGLYDDNKTHDFCNGSLYKSYGNIDECKDVVSKMVANIVNRTIMEFFFRVYHYVE